MVQAGVDGVAQGQQVVVRHGGERAVIKLTHGADALKAVPVR